MSKCDFCTEPCGNTHCEQTELETDAVYVHQGNGNEYVIESYAKIQVDNVWVDAVIYRQRKMYDMKFVRTVTEFKQKFTKQEGG